MEILASEVPLTCTGLVEAAVCHTTVTAVHHIPWENYHKMQHWKLTAVANVLQKLAHQKRWSLVQQC
eukprot:556763-Ditylum_brightwellii.AAC.1